MTENELRKLPAAARRRLPENVLMSVGLTTREEGREILEAEGWAFAGLDLRWLNTPPSPDRTDEEEVWARTVGGVTEWCLLLCAGEVGGIPPERRWDRVESPFDPRLMSGE